jgi:hypothetical protein
MAKMHPVPSTWLQLCRPTMCRTLEHNIMHASAAAQNNGNSALARLWVSQLVPVACSSVHKYCSKGLHIHV